MYLIASAPFYLGIEMKVLYVIVRMEGFVQSLTGHALISLRVVCCRFVDG